MSLQESINRKEFLIKLGFSGASLMAVLSSCINAHQSVIEPVNLIPNAPSVSASTVTESPITITTESAGTILVFKDTTQISVFTAVAGINTYTPSTAGTYTFQLQTTSGTSVLSASVIVIAKTIATPASPTISVTNINTNNAIVITTVSAGTIIVFNGNTQITTFNAIAGANTYTPPSAGTYTFKLQTTNGISGARPFINRVVGIKTQYDTVYGTLTLLDF